MTETEARAFIDGDGHRARFIIGEGRTRDELSISGAWLATRDPVELWP